MEKGVFHTEISFLNLVEPNLDCSSTFRIDFAPNGIPFRAKSIRKCVGTIQIYFYSTRLRNDFARARFIGASNIYIYIGESNIWLKVPGDYTERFSI